MKDSTGLRMLGVVEILDTTDPNNTRLLLKKNAIHEGNMVYALAKSLIGQDSANTSAIGWFAFGDGGSDVSETGQITYRPTNTSKMRNAIADLHQRVYQKSIRDDGFIMSVSPVIHPTAIADIKISCTLNKGEPSGQLPTDNSQTFNDNFIFDEVGLFTNASDIEEAYMLSHIVFHPIQKSLNRKIEIKYTIRLEIV